MNLTIAQFAEQCQISVQAVYRRLDTDLKQFVTDVNNKKMIDSKAVEYQLSKRPLKPNAPIKDVQTVDTGLWQKIQQLETAIATLNHDNEVLQERLKEKDETIKYLQEQITAKDEQIRAGLINANQLAALTNQMAELQRTMNSSGGFFRRLISGKKKAGT